MPLRRKLIRIGDNSRAVIIPADWLRYQEEQNGGHEIHCVLLEVNGIIKVSVDTPKELEPAKP